MTGCHFNMAYKIEELPMEVLRLRDAQYRSVAVTLMRLENSTLPHPTLTTSLMQQQPFHLCVKHLMYANPAVPELVRMTPAISFVCPKDISYVSFCLCQMLHTGAATTSSVQSAESRGRSFSIQVELNSFTPSCGRVTHKGGCGTPLLEPK